MHKIKTEIVLYANKETVVSLSISLYHYEKQSDKKKQNKYRLNSKIVSGKYLYFFLLRRYSKFCLTCAKTLHCIVIKKGEEGGKPGSCPVWVHRCFDIQSSGILFGEMRTLSIPLWADGGLQQPASYHGFQDLGN